MRNRLDEGLSKLNNNLINMGCLIEKAIDVGVSTLIERDVKLYEHSTEIELEVNAIEKEIEGICLKLILHQQPVAKDLRAISSALKMITDMERIGDGANDISKLSLSIIKNTHMDCPIHIKQMSEATIKMVSDAITAFVKKDTELALAVIKYDDIVDKLFYTVKDDLIKMIHDDGDLGPIAIDFLMISKYLERIGDHAVNIAEWVLFSITGKHKK